MIKLNRGLSFWQKNPKIPSHKLLVFYERDTTKDQKPKNLYKRGQTSQRGQNPRETHSL